MITRILILIALAAALAAAIFFATEWLERYRESGDKAGVWICTGAVVAYYVCIFCGALALLSTP